ncbi:MAG: ubiquinone/menaquinone biosynthesis methyltransferase [Alphaproteobacteria bacterium]|nr:ubiquinone/menaquinone biosynthesis methyltransferase [Alphaproteobacteria bacterium]
MRRFNLMIGDHLKTPETKKYYNEQVFSEIAPRYDFITRALSLWRDAVWKQNLIAALPEKNNSVCLDLACGTGDIAFLLAGKYPQGQITGLDITEPMLEIARSRNSYSNVSFINQDMSHLEFSGNSVDIITGSYALRNAPDLDTVISEMHRVLKPGGYAAILDFSKPQSKMGQELEYWLLKIWAGFWGILLHRNHEVYSYIAESLQAYPDRVILKSTLENQGFFIKQSSLYFGGITELLLIQKNISENV